MSLRRSAAGSGCAALTLATLALSALAQVAAMPEYAPARQVSGVIRICGSPQMGDLLHLYEAGFRKLQPNVQFQEDLQSTVTAVSGVSSQHADLGLLGREIWPPEERAFAAAKGHPPNIFEVATGSYDVPKATFALMIFVPRANPLASVSMEQLARTFGESAAPIRTWGQLGLTGAWAQRPIRLYGFSRDNDKAQIFSKLVFRNNETWTAGLHEFSNAPAPNGDDAGKLILDAVAADPDAIAISNVHYASPAVRAVPVTAPNGNAPIAPTRQSVSNRSYPLSRAVYVVFDGKASNPAAVEFLRFILSRQGQQAVQREGNYLPLPPKIALEQLRKLHTEKIAP